MFDSEVLYSDPHLTYLTENRIVLKINWSHAVVQVSKLTLKMLMHAQTKVTKATDPIQTKPKKVNV